MRGIAMLVALTWGTTVGCSSTCDPNNIRGTCMAGEECRGDSSCASGRCEYPSDPVAEAGRCSAPCDGPADCASDEYCTLTFGGVTTCNRRCVGELVGDTSGRFCQDGTAVTCESSPDRESVCDRCGCPGTGEECRGCDSSFCYCAVPAAIGEPCTFNDLCRSGNCVGPEGSRRCELASGTACGAATSTECSRCDRPDMACRQGCRGIGDCSANELCLGNRSTGEYWCYTDCSDSAVVCPSGTTCEYTADFSDEYCRPSP
jgi:hypothetical protein